MKPVLSRFRSCHPLLVAFFLASSVTPVHAATAPNPDSSSPLAPARGVAGTEAANPNTTTPDPDLAAAEASPATEGEAAVLGEASTARNSRPNSTDAGELQRLQREKQEILTRLELEAARRQAELSKLRSEIDTIETETHLAAARREHQAEQLRRQLSAAEERQAVLAAKRAEVEHELALAKAKLALELQDTTRQLELVKARQVMRTKVAVAPEYRTEPFVNGVLEVSDRRIALNGPITMALADRVTEELQFYNNKSRSYPVFIVIDYSPGGSVMAGYRILEAMEASEAPVHVVVKSLAASMAAVITTLAPHSYAYPNAILLHHQLSGTTFGNLTEQREQVEQAAEWSRRLMAPVCKKLGMTEEQFVRQMYEHDSKGDWSEFADRAQQLGWVQHVADEVRELGTTELASSRQQAQAASATDDDVGSNDAQPQLPRLQPFDHWFLYDPEGQFQRSPRHAGPRAAGVGGER